MKPGQVLAYISLAWMGVVGQVDQTITVTPLAVVTFPARLAVYRSCHRSRRRCPRSRRRASPSTMARVPCGALRPGTAAVVTTTSMPFEVFGQGALLLLALLRCQLARVAAAAGGGDNAQIKELGASDSICSFTSGRTSNLPPAHPAAARGVMAQAPPPPAPTISTAVGRMVPAAVVSMGRTAPPRRRSAPPSAGHRGLRTASSMAWARVVAAAAHGEGSDLRSR